MPPNDTVIDVAASEILKSDVALPLEPTLLSPAQRMLKDIEGMTIDADPMYAIAGSELSRIKGAYNKLESERLDLTRPLDEVKKKIMARYSKPLEVLAAAEAALKGKMLTFHTEREAKAKAERERLEAIARAERERLAHEAAELERKAAEEAAVAKAKAEAEVAELEKSGKAQEAASVHARAAERAAELRERAEADARALRETAAVVVAAPASTATPAAKGTSVRTTFKARVIDKPAFIRAVADTPQFEALLDVNESGLNAMARSLKTNLRIPGIEVYEERGMAARGA